MPTKKRNITERYGSPPIRSDEQPLLLFLTHEASKRGHSLVQLSRSIGLSYRRLAQFRRGEANIKNSERKVLELAAQYLSLPVVSVLMHAGVVKVEDFSWPQVTDIDARLKNEILRMRKDPVVGPFVPEELDGAALAIQRFTLQIFNEMLRARGAPHVNWWDEGNRHKGIL